MEKRPDAARDGAGPLSLSDLLAFLAALIAIPYAAGFAMWLSYLSAFHIGFSEVSLAQGHYLQGAMRVVRSLYHDGHLLPEWTVAALLAMPIALVILALLFPRGMAASARAAGSALRRNLRLLVVALLVVAVLTALTVGSRHGHAEAMQILDRSRTLPVAGFLTLGPKNRTGRIDAIEAETLMTSHLGTTVLFSDGRSAFLITRRTAQSDPAILRVPLGGDRVLFSIRGKETSP